MVEAEDLCCQAFVREACGMFVCLFVRLFVWCGAVRCGMWVVWCVTRWEKDAAVSMIVKDAGGVSMHWEGESSPPREREREKDADIGVHLVSVRLDALELTTPPVNHTYFLS